MLAYAANRPDPARRHSSPNVMLFIVAAHVAAIAALMSAKMDVGRPFFRPTQLIKVPLPPIPPKPRPVQPTKRTPASQPIERVSQPIPRLPTSPDPVRPIESHGPTTFDPEPSSDTGTHPVFLPQPPRPIPLPVARTAQLLTPASQLRPPYPESKLLNEEEATLHLRLTIGVDGRVTSVEPIGRVDAVFLDAARRYLLAHWRYSPASVDGRAIASTNEIMLSFKLDS